MSLCSGNTDIHCCEVNGKPCRFLEENTVKGRRWVCGLRRELGSWEAVHRSPDYLTYVKPRWIERGVSDCGDWPGPGEVCGVCGATG